MIIPEQNIKQQIKSDFLFLIELILDGKEEYKSAVNEVLKEAKDFTNKKKTIWNINRAYFDIIIELSTKYQNILKDGNIDNFDNNSYREIYNLLKYNG